MKEILTEKGWRLCEWGGVWLIFAPGKSTPTKDRFSSYKADEIAIRKLKSLISPGRDRCFRACLTRLPDAPTRLDLAATGLSLIYVNKSEKWKEDPSKIERARLWIVNDFKEKTIPFLESETRGEEALAFWVSPLERNRAFLVFSRRTPLIKKH